MEDVLDLYQQPYDPDYPVICMDEKPYQLLGETRHAIPMKRGRPKRLDDEYVCNGTCCIFLFTETLSSWRHVDPQEHRTMVDWAHQIRRLLEIEYPNCLKIRLVMDNLNTHTISCKRQVLFHKWGCGRKPGLRIRQEVVHAFL